jgi:transcriptional regulator with XRE-family HTH domain
MELSVTEKIRSLLKNKNVPIIELGSRLGKSKQNMSNKLKRDNYTINELKEIAKVMDCTLEVNFIDKEGNKF